MLWRTLDNFVRRRLPIWLPAPLFFDVPHWLAVHVETQPRKAEGHEKSSEVPFFDVAFPAPHAS